MIHEAHKLVSLPKMQSVRIWVGLQVDAAVVN